MVVTSDPIVQHKLMRGLVDAYQLTGNEQALQVVTTMADWAVLLTWTNSTGDFGPISYQVLVDGARSRNVLDTRPRGTPVGATSTVWVR